MKATAKTILMLRHGKSDWEASFSSDHERPLAERGRKASRLVGRWLARARLVPDLAVTSDAVRARSTVELAVEAGGWQSDVRLEPSFYGGSTDALLSVLRDLGEDVRRVLLAGHLPTWPRAIGRLTGAGGLRFPTAAVAGISYTGSWRNLSPGSCELCWLVTPKLLARAGAE